MKLTRMVLPALLVLAATAQADALLVQTNTDLYDASLTLLPATEGDGLSASTGAEQTAGDSSVLLSVTSSSLTCDADGNCPAGVGQLAPLLSIDSIGAPHGGVQPVGEPPTVLLAAGTVLALTSLLVKRRNH